MTDDLPDLYSLSNSPEFAKAIGDLVLHWNKTEGTVRGLLSTLCAPQSETSRVCAEILTVEIGNVALTNAIRSIARALYSEELEEHLICCAEYLDRLRAYRNYYVHSIKGATDTQTGPIGIATQVVAKSRYALNWDLVETRDIETVTRRCIYLHRYAHTLTLHVEDVINDSPAPQELPDKPPLPDVLKKQATRLSSRE
jgi:hypothetical protein